MLVDLHVHSTASGGPWAPRDVYGYVRGHGIERFSITDLRSSEDASCTGGSQRALPPGH